MLAAGLALAGCNVPGDTGYVEIRTVPASLDTYRRRSISTRVKLDPVQKGVAVLKHRTGTAKLSAEAVGGQVGPVRHRGAEEPHHHGDGVGAGAAAALPVPQQRRQRRLRELAGLAAEEALDGQGPATSRFIHNLSTGISQPAGSRAYTL